MLRDGERERVRLEVGEREEEMVMARTKQPTDTSRLGLRVQNLTPEIASQLGFDGEQGVVITQVQPGSPAAEAGLRPGIMIKEVNRKAVEDIRQFQNAIENKLEDKPVLFLVDDGRSTRFVALRVR